MVDRRELHTPRSGLGRRAMSPDEQHIRTLLAQYAHVHDHMDVEGLVGLFAHDGRLTGTAGATATGQRAIREMMTRIYARRRAAGASMKHLYANSVIEVRGKLAEATTDIVAYERTGDGAWSVLLVGAVMDQLTRESGQWLFADRRVVDARKAWS